jgi:hypothetical protein
MTSESPILISDGNLCAEISCRGKRVLEKRHQPGRVVHHQARRHSVPTFGIAFVIGFIPLYLSMAN